jgi:hypothetical protein
VPLEERSAELDAGNIEAIIQAASQYPLTSIKAAKIISNKADVHPPQGNGRVVVLVA